jgi:hypothetical protein
VPPACEARKPGRDAANWTAKIYALLITINYHEKARGYACGQAAAGSLAQKRNIYVEFES